MPLRLPSPRQHHHVAAYGWRSDRDRSERTRWQVVESLRNKIVRNGGNVPGRRAQQEKYHIPDAIYRMLG